MGTFKIAIIGKQCAGKSSAAKAVIWALGNCRTAKIKFADPIYSTMRALNVSKNRGFMQDFSDLTKRYFGDDFFVEALADKIKRIESSKLNYNLIVCDDVRYQKEFDFVKLVDFKTIYVAADREVRRKRAEDRGLEFKENHSSENQVETIGRLADVQIDNSIDNKTMLENRIAFILQHKLAA